MAFSKDELRWIRREIAPYGGHLRGLRSNAIGHGGADRDTPCFVDKDGLFDPVLGKDAAGYDERIVLEFEALPGNSVHDGLARIDAKMTPHRGLRRLGDDRRLSPIAEPLQGRSLLLVHGTFSNGDDFFGQLAQHQSGLVDRMLELYKNVLIFDYPTVSQQAIASAIALDSQIRCFVPEEIDVVSHSQGGLVVRYWLELLARERLGDTVSIFVGGTLAGTALAAPWALRRALRGLFNMSRWLKLVSSPLMPMVADIISFLGRTAGLLADSPITDAGVALVPGFQGMSQVSTNAELIALQRSVRSVPPRYYAITGDFEPEPTGWKLWQRLYSRTANAGADLLFQEPNDLVVNTSAMTHLADGKPIPDDRVVHYAAGVRPVHHTNYFEQPATAEALADWLQLR